MRCHILCVTLLAGSLTGCSFGGSAHRWEDPRYATSMDAAGSVFKLGYIPQAQQQYKTALRRAFLADDAQAIHDAGFNLATSQLRLKALDECLKTVNKVSTALTVRGWGEERQADLHLIRSAVLFQKHRWVESEKEARLARASRDVDAHYEAYGLIGLNAAELHNRQHLEEAIEHLSESDNARDQTMLKELQIHQKMMNGQWKDAASTALLLIQLREKALEYEAMQRALTLRAVALKAMGDTKQSDFLMRRARESNTASKE